MTEPREIVFSFEKDLNNNRYSYNKFIKFYNTFNELNHQKIILDFSNVNFLSANLLAVLGCCAEHTTAKKKNRIVFRNLHPKIKAVMQKTGFGRHFSWDNIDDIDHDSMGYDIFESTTEHLADFERYLLLNIFSRSTLPTMSAAYRNSIIDNLLEMFNNVIDHADSSHVYVCGQISPKNMELCFSIVDIGRTINENVTSYLKDISTDFPDNSLEWAIISGNSTKALEAPGGLGFSTLLDFLKHNNGSFILISDKEIYELKKGKDNFNMLDLSFPGTIVTITINLKDGQLYFLDQNKKESIVF